MKLLRDYQIPAVQTLVTGLGRHNACLDASEMGVGKSYVGLATALETNRRPIVICRKAAVPSWRRCADHFNVKNMMVTNWEMLRTGNLPMGEWSSTVKDGKKPKTIWMFDWNLRPNDLLIFDEVHSAKNPASDNAELVYSAAAAGVKMLGLSATAANNPLHMKALGFALGLHRGFDYYPWTFRNGIIKTKFGFQFSCGMSYHEQKKDPAKLDQLQQEVMRQIHAKIFGQGRGVRIRKNDIPGFPKNQIIPVALDFGDATSAIGRAYAELQEKIDQWKGNPLAIMRHAQVEIERLKVPGLVDCARAMIEEGRHVVMFLNFNESVDAACAAFKTKCCVRGGQTAAVREANIAAFQADMEEVIICNSQAGGESISLHDLHGRFPRGTVICPSFWAENILQDTGRTPRNGALTDVVQKIVFVANSVEDNSMINCQRKSDNISMLNDGDLSSSLKFKEAA